MSPKLPVVTAKELLRALQKDGWLEARQRGSHLSLIHPVKPGTVVVPMHSGRDLRPATLSRILTSAGLSIDDLRRLL